MDWVLLLVALVTCQAIALITTRAMLWCALRAVAPARRAKPRLPAVGLD